MPTETAISDKRVLVMALLCFFLGVLGIHRFYVGKLVTGLIQLFTAGGLGIWWIIDLVLILLGLFKDKEGRPIKQWI